MAAFGLENRDRITGNLPEKRREHSSCQVTGGLATRFTAVCFPAIGDVNYSHAIFLFVRKPDIAPAGVTEKCRGSVAELFERKLSSVRRLRRNGLSEPSFESGVDRVSTRVSRLAEGGDRLGRLGSRKDCGAQLPQSWNGDSYQIQIGCFHHFTVQRLIRIRETDSAQQLGFVDHLDSEAPCFLKFAPSFFTCNQETRRF